MEFVNERIHRIPLTELSILEHRLCVATKPGVHSSYGVHKLHCLYFERIYESTAFENRSSLFQTDEYRICYRDQDLSTLKLEKKSATNGMSCTEVCDIPREMVHTILQGTYSEIIRDSQGRTGEELDPLLQEFYWEVIGRGLQPKIVIVYDTKPYYYYQGNAQVMINYNPGVSHDLRAYLDPYQKVTSVKDNQAIVHVTWDHYLPDVVRTAFLMTGIAESSAQSIYNMM